MYSLPCFVAIAPFLLFDTSHVLSGQHFTNNDLDIVVVRRAWSMLPLSIAYTCTLFRISLVLHCDINIRNATLILTSFDLVSCPRLATRQRSSGNAAAPPRWCTIRHLWRSISLGSHSTVSLVEKTAISLGYSCSVPFWHRA